MRNRPAKTTPPPAPVPAPLPEKDWPMPSEGGSWVRQPDGSLLREVETESPVEPPLKGADNAD
tara:strand:+ start:29419 stop:29607 length:189 start_codon:yes stop_codon:yes gene_type:complete